MDRSRLSIFPWQVKFAPGNCGWPDRNSFRYGSKDPVAGKHHLKRLWTELYNFERTLWPNLFPIPLRSPSPAGALSPPECSCSHLP